MAHQKFTFVCQIFSIWMDLTSKKSHMILFHRSPFVAIELIKRNDVDAQTKRKGVRGYVILVGYVSWGFLLWTYLHQIRNELRYAMFHCMLRGLYFNQSFFAIPFCFHSEKFCFMTWIENISIRFCMIWKRSLFSFFFFLITHSQILRLSYVWKLWQFFIFVTHYIEI